MESNRVGRKFLTNGFFSSATIAQEYDKFWVGLESSPVQVVQRGSIIAPTTGISTTRRPVAPTVPVYVPEVKATVRKRFSKHFRLQLMNSIPFS